MSYRPEGVCRVWTLGMVLHVWAQKSLGATEAHDSFGLSQSGLAVIGSACPAWGVTRKSAQPHPGAWCHPRQPCLMLPGSRLEPLGAGSPSPSSHSLPSISPAPAAVLTASVKGRQVAGLSPREQTGEPGPRDSLWADWCLGGCWPGLSAFTILWWSFVQEHYLVWEIKLIGFLLGSPLPAPLSPCF